MTRYRLMAIMFCTACGLFVIGGFAEDFGYQHGGSMLNLVGCFCLLITIGGAMSVADEEKETSKASLTSDE